MTEPTMAEASGANSARSEPKRTQQDEGTIEDDAHAFDFVDWGPPPDMRQRELIFDSLAKIVLHGPSKHHSRGQAHGENRGTYIFTWGAGYQGQLGRKFIRGQKKYSAVPLIIDMDVVIRQVVCGGLHTAVVTESGDVYTWGDGRKGELGHIHDPSLKQTPRLVDALDNVFITQVACGGSHTVAITDNGQMWSWGWAKYGQTGHGERQIQKTPKRCDHELGREIVSVACGNKHTLAINRRGMALSFGCGEHGQTGHGDGNDRLFPTKIDSLADQTITYVAAGAIHSCFISEDGDLHLCGFGEYFHPNESQHFFYSTKKIDMPEPMKQVACGQSHNAALSVSGNVYCWGSGEYGQLGYGIKGNLSTPRLVLDGKNIAQVSAGRYHSFGLSSAGVLYSWGCGENGQLGLNSDENIALPSVVTTILGTVVGQVSCGEHHTAVLTSAPWSKLSTDVAEWHYKAKHETEAKQRILKKTHRGLTKKDLQKLAEEMRKFEISHNKRKKETEAEEKEDMARDIASIQYKEALGEDVMKAMEDPEASKTMRLPEVGSSKGGDDDDDNVGRPGGGEMVAQQQAQQQPEEGTARFPKVSQKGRKRKTAVAQNMDSSYGGRQQQQQQQQQLAGTLGLSATTVSGSGVPFSRTAFLKETAQMVRRMTAVVQDKGEAHNQKQLQKMLRMVFSFRKDYDALRHTARNKAKILLDMKKELKLLTKTSQLSKETHDECYQRLKGLEMQLNTVTIKIAETGENRKNYELNIAHLKEEDFEHFNQLKALRKQNTDNNSFFKKMNELKIAALEEKEKAEAELEEFRLEIESYQKFVSQQLGQFEQILEIVRSQNEKRERAKTTRTERNRAKIASRIDKLEHEAEAADKEASGLSARLTSLDLKLRHFEDSFQKITAATGLTNPDAIVNKFYFKGEIKEQLQTEIDDKQSSIEDLRTTQQDLKEDLEQSRANFREQTWRDVEHLSEASREVGARSNKKGDEVALMAQRLAFVQEGLLTLLRCIQGAEGVEDSLKLDNGNIWRVEESNDVFSRMDQYVDVLLEAERENKKQMEIEAERRRLAEEENAGQAFTAPFGLDRKALTDLKSQDTEDEGAGRGTGRGTGRATGRESERAGEGSASARVDEEADRPGEE